MADSFETLAQKYALKYDVKLTTGIHYMEINRTVIARVAELLADDAGLLNDIARETLHEREETVEKMWQKLEAQTMRLQETRRAYDQEYADIKAKKLEAERLLKQAQEQAESVLQVETSEARDKVRLLEMFKQTVNDNASAKGVQFTPQNQTAFITACGNILSGTQFVMNAPAPDAEAEEPKQGKKVKKLSY